ncbi:hypothetical protein Tsubulata_042495 [Turnera subulata]|uniref:Uncharacterized protein n=1 Tax=Turnera subulata TaxID=218843 RepID=A0A9Q0FC45_9ROSI|nr:hypothetical protein Tsubulata_042495 [Turnera subulata]
MIFQGTKPTAFILLILVTVLAVVIVIATLLLGSLIWKMAGSRTGVDITAVNCNRQLGSQKCCDLGGKRRNSIIGLGEFLGSYGDQMNTP